MKFYCGILSLALLTTGAEAFLVKHKATSSALNAFTTSAEAGPIADRSPLDRESTSVQRRPLKSRLTEADVTVQGGSLRTWAFNTAERVQVQLKTEGRPLDCDIELWHGPDNTPQKLKVYIEDGSLRPFNAVIETPRGPNTVSVRNIGHLEFPLAASVSGMIDESVAGIADVHEKESIIIQGGALRTFGFNNEVDSVQIFLRTDGRPLNARIELLQGPNNNKQVVELYTEDGIDRPFYGIFSTPGSGNVVRVVNTSPMEFPLSASVDAYEINSGQYEDNGALMGGL